MSPLPVLPAELRQHIFSFACESCMVTLGVDAEAKVRFYSPLAGLESACWESRQIATRNRTRMLMLYDGSALGVWFNFGTDTLYIDSRAANMIDYKDFLTQYNFQDVSGSRYRFPQAEMVTSIAIDQNLSWLVLYKLLAFTIVPTSRFNCADTMKLLCSCENDVLTAEMLSKRPTTLKMLPDDTLMRIEDGERFTVGDLKRNYTSYPFSSRCYILNKLPTLEVYNVSFA